MPLHAQTMNPSSSSGDLAVRKATQQLQLAMQSVRRRRRLSSALSARSDGPKSNNNCDDDLDSDSDSSLGSALSDQENVNCVNMLAECFSSSSSSDEEEEDYAVRKPAAVDMCEPEAGERKRATMPTTPMSMLRSLDWTDSGFMASDDVTVASMDSFQDHDWEATASASPVDDGMIDRVTKKALDWMQQDVESQARANRSMQQQLHGALVLIHSVVSSVVSLETPEDVQEIVANARSLSPEKLTPLANWWKEALEDWHARTQSEKQSAVQSFDQCQEEGAARLQTLVSLHEREREELQTRVVQLQEALNQQQMDSADQTSRLVLLLKDTNRATCDALDGHQRAVNRLLMRIEDAESELFRCRTQEKCASLSPWSQTSTEEGEKQLMDLLANAKAAELSALRWQMAYDEQAARTLQAQECLQMLQEEWSQLKIDHSQTKRSLATAIPFGQLKSYQQKLVLLQAQVEDTKAQVACDHEQFLYEQTKWTNEKRQIGREVEEVHNVSMKVLKVLLLREKLLKRQEKQFMQRQELLQQQQQGMAAERSALQSILQNVLKESAVVLLAVQQITVCKQDPSAANAPHRLPVKPIQLMKLIKRLKRMEEALGGTSGSERQPPLSEDTQ